MATFGETPWALLLPGNCASNARIPVDGIGLTIGSGCVQDMTFGRHLPHLDLCMPNVEPSHCALTYERVDRVCVLHDLSESGTWLNGRRLGLGHAVDLRDGDVIALAPPAQGGQATGPVSFTFLYTHEQAQEVPVAEQQPGPAMRHKRSSAWLPHQRPNCPTRLQCGICSQALVQAVTMEPCSHSFCATCMSEHMGRQLQAGLAPRCPHRCSHPQQFVRANHLLRDLVQAAGPATPGAAVCPSTTPEQGSSAGASTYSAAASTALAAARGARGTRRAWAAVALAAATSSRPPAAAAVSSPIWPGYLPLSAVSCRQPYLPQHLRTCHTLSSCPPCCRP
ncbi:hypothetical protein V8C86DRAFT_362435 [Haematococcus lacustris]